MSATAMFSDVHNRLHFCVSLSAGSDKVGNSKNKNTCKERVKWNQRKADDFLKVLRDDSELNVLQNIDDKLMNVEHSHMTLDQENSIVNDLCLFYNESTTSAFGTHNLKTNFKDDCKHWFTKECSIKRVHFMRLK